MNQVSSLSLWEEKKIVMNHRNACLEPHRSWEWKKRCSTSVCFSFPHYWQFLQTPSVKISILSCLQLSKVSWKQVRNCLCYLREGMGKGLEIRCLWSFGNDCAHLCPEVVLSIQECSAFVWKQVSKWVTGSLLPGTEVILTQVGAVKFKGAWVFSDG